MFPSQCFRTHRSMLPSLLLLLTSHILRAARGDNYAVNSTNKSLLVAAGCFWCAEQAFEQYAPGVIEAISGYAGPNGIDNPTYRNHAGHYEVVLVEYDPTKTSYKVLVEYAWRNIDPMDGGGQFCDRGFSYKPAIFYANDEERLDAEQVKTDVLSQYGWDESTIAVSLLERPTFWIAEDYHQNYYMKNPKNYGYYKNACGRTNDLKSVWGEEEYYCYHDYNLAMGCFNKTVMNQVGDVVDAEINMKNAPEEVVGRMPLWAIVLQLSAAITLGSCLLLYSLASKCRREDIDKDGTVARSASNGDSTTK